MPAWQAPVSAKGPGRGGRRRVGPARGRSRSTPLRPSSGSNSSGHQQVEQRVAVPRVVGGTPAASIRREQGLARSIGPSTLVAADPGDVAGPAPAFDVEAAVFAPQLLDDGGQPLGAGAGPSAPRSAAGTAAGSPEGPSLDAAGGRCSRYSVTFIIGVREAEHSRTTCTVLRRELVHHHAAVLAVADLRDERRHLRPPSSGRGRPLAS